MKTLRILPLLLATAIFAASREAAAQNCSDCVAAGGACNSCGPNGACLGGEAANPAVCTADGVCYPKCTTWGYYQVGWRPWPGDRDDPLPPGADTRDDIDLPPIPASEEDLLAPPPAEAGLEDEEEEGDGAEGSGAGDPLPSVPPLPPLGVPPTSPDGDDPPPALPPLPGFERPLSPGPASGDGFSATPPPIRRFAANPDLPPALPASFGAVMQASVSIPTGAGGSTSGGRVQPIGVFVTGPQSLPTSR